jgi:hypothetical protein
LHAIGSHQTTPFDDLAEAEDLAETSIVGVHPTNHVVVDADAAIEHGKSTVAVDGDTYSMPYSIASRLSELISGTEIEAGDFLEGNPDKSIRLVRTLARIGAVRVQSH